MPSDLALTFGCTIDTRRRIPPGEPVIVLALVQVRSDKLALSANDAETHRLGGRVDRAVYVERADPSFAQLSEHLHHLLAPGGQSDIYDIEPARYVQGVDAVAVLGDPGEQQQPADLPPIVMADVVTEHGGPAHHVEHADLQRLELSPARFYDAAHKLRAGQLIGDVTQGWTTEQAEYLAGFLSKPKPKRPRRAATPKTGNAQGDDAA